MTTTQRRWTCGTCNSTVLAPGKPRADDVRRFCLDCSKMSGRLVRRTCPALDKQRAATKERAAARTVTKRDRERAAEKAKRTIDGVDMLDEAKRFWRLPTIVDARRRYRPNRKLPDIEWRRSKSKWYTSGRCWSMSNRICVTLGKGEHDAASCVLHELVHAVLPSGEHHGHLFDSTMRSAYREAFPERADRASGDGQRFWNQQKEAS